MRSRPSALVALAASLALVVVSVVGWLSARNQGVGDDLEQVTTTRSAVLAASDRVADRSPVPKQDEPADRSGATDESSEPVPVVDATQIVIPEPVDPPSRVSIPSVGIDMPVRATGVQRDGQMALPDDPTVMGWYEYGALPGDRRGSAVLAGHVDSDEFGVGPLNRLASVQRGDRITVTGPDGEPLRYQVRSVERIVRSALPTDRLFAEDVPHRLALVTCGGRYLPDAGGYEDNIVVIATPVSS